MALAHWRRDPPPLGNALMPCGSGRTPGSQPSRASAQSEAEKLCHLAGRCHAAELMGRKKMSKRDLGRCCREVFLAKTNPWVLGEVSMPAGRSVSMPTSSSAQGLGSVVLCQQFDQTIPVLMAEALEMVRSGGILEEGSSWSPVEQDESRYKGYTKSRRLLLPWDTPGPCCWWQCGAAGSRRMGISYEGSVTYVGEMIAEHLVS